MVEAERADNRWKRFWGSTATLREVVEFGDPDADNGGWQDRTDAANLLILQFSIGLMMMDHLIGPLRPLDYDRSSAIQNLLPGLDDAAREMIAIDQFNGKFWSESIRHLAIRRAWLSTGTAPSGAALSADTEPTLADFIRALAGDTENLLALVYVALRNSVERAALAAAFKAAEVDLRAEIALAELLLAISPRAIGVDSAQLDAARQVLHDTPGSS
jgi:hypothetical protein